MKEVLRDPLKATVHIVLAFNWLYMGLVPKLLFPGTGETAMVVQSGLFPGMEGLMVTLFGIAEVVFGLSFLVLPWRILHWLNIAALLLLGTGATLIDTGVQFRPFNPVVVSVPMMALSVLVLRARK